MSARITTFEQYLQDYKRSVEDPEAFWAEIADNFVWRKKWDKVLEWNFKGPDVKWFIGGKLNITENCIDRHLANKGEQTAIIWEPNNPNEAIRKLTYNQLFDEVCKFSQVLKNNGVKKGDRVCIYMPMVPEAAIAMLACARIGAIHSVVFAGFSVQSLIDRINDSSCEVVVTADGLYRGAKTIELKSIIDESLKDCPCVKKVIVLQRTGTPVNMKIGRDVYWNDEMTTPRPPKGGEGWGAAEEMDAEDMLYILYTSGSTGKPKGVVHTTAGYMVYTWYSFINVFQYNKGDVYWCTADIGWVTGHSYTIYAPLLAGATILMFEGIPVYPDAGRFWQVIDKHKVNIFYTAPTAIRSLMAAGLDFVKPYNLESLRVLGTVGEPINEEAWLWYNDNIGKKNCPIVDTWWQTETGGILISPLAGITETKPGYATLPLPGVQPAIMDSSGNLTPSPLSYLTPNLSPNGEGRRGEVEGRRGEVEGNLCIKFPWPSMIRTTYSDHERCRLNYFDTYPDMYFTGDGARRDADGYYHIIGRVDDVLKVSGHRLGTADIEDAINHAEGVVESAVVGYPHPIKGQGIYAFVIYNKDITNAVDTMHGDTTKDEILRHVTNLIGPIAKPDKIQFVKGLPKTRSGKIMRRILRKIAEGDVSNLGDTSTLIDPGVVEEIKKGIEN